MKMKEAASPIDHGWAWVICAAGCFLHIVVVGSVRSTGILLASVSEHYNRSKRDSAWIMGLYYLVFLTLTPITMAMARRYSVRWLVLAGGMFLFSGYTLSYFAMSLEFLYFTIGVLAGTGMALTHPPTVLLVNYYFDRHRTAATGIVMGGCSVGALCMPALMNALLDRYSFRGCMLFWGAITLNVAVASALMRPFVATEPDPVAATGSAAEADAVRTIADGAEKPLMIAEAVPPLRESQEEPPRRHSCDRHCKSAENLHCSGHGGGCDDEVPQRRSNSVASLRHQHHRRQWRLRRQPRQKQPSVTLGLSLRAPPRLTMLASCGDVSILVGLPASVAALAASEAPATATATALANGGGAAEAARQTLRSRLERTVRSLNLNPSLLRNPRCWFLISSLALAIQGMPFNFMILPQHGKSIGMQPDEYTRLVQYQGITDLIVRVGIGFVADRQLIRRQLMMVALVIAQGALWCLLLHPSHAAALAFSLLEGLLAGGLVTNLAPILVDTFGVDNLPTTYGFMGILESGVMLGVPVLLGDLYDKTGSWNTSVIFVALMITLSGLMLLADDLLHLRSKRRELKRGQQIPC